MQNELTQQDLQLVYNWVDEIPLSRPKRNMSRDFSDTVLMAQLIAHFYPNIVQVHNYIATGSIKQKIVNWNTINRIYQHMLEKVLKKMKISLRVNEIQSLSNGQPQFIERLLLLVRNAIQKGDMIAPSMISKTNTKLSFQSKLSENKPKILTWKQIQKKQEVKDIISNKDKSIEQLKHLIEMLSYKHFKMEEIIKSKDKQIQELVRIVKDKHLV